MADNYQFRDAYGSVLTAAATEVSGALQPIVRVAGSIISVGSSVTNQSVSGTVVLGGGQSSVSGVGVFNVNHVGNGSVLSIIPGSVATVSSPASVSGVGLFNVNNVGNGSILAIIPGSVATAPYPASVSGVGVFNTNHIGNGSVITVWSNPSVAGTYAEDTTHSNGERGIFVLGVRNDTVASFVSANTDYGPIGTDSAGRVMTIVAPEESRVSGYGSVNGTSVTTAIAAAGTGIRNYITNIEVVNTGSVATLVTFQDGAASVIGFTIAPATGGSNINTVQMPMRTGANTTFDFRATSSPSTLYVTARGYKAP